MGVLIEVQGPFLSLTDENSEFELEGNTVAEVVKELSQKYHNLADSIRQPHVQLFLNEVHIRIDRDGAIPVPDGSRMQLVWNIQGGR